jgi:hypothetical protein
MPWTDHSSAGLSTAPSAGDHTAGLQEVADAVVASLAVDVRDVVALDVEGLLLRAPASLALEEDLVEGLLPAARVQGRGRGRHAVEVKQDGVVVVGGDGGHAGSPAV